MPKEWVKDLEVPLHWLVPELTVELDDDDLEEVQMLNPLSTLEVVNGSGELLPFQQPYFFASQVTALAKAIPRSQFQTGLQISPVTF